MATQHTKDAENESKSKEHLDSLGQENPAFNLERKNIAEAAKRNEEAAKAAKDKEAK